MEEAGDHAGASVNATGRVGSTLLGAALQLSDAFAGPAFRGVVRVLGVTRAADGWRGEVSRVE